MAEKKHRMLFQGQDPSQAEHRPSSLSIQQPPSYEEAISHRNSLRCLSTANISDYLAEMQEEEDNRNHSFVNVTIAEPLRHSRQNSRTESLPDDDGDNISIDIGNAIQMQPLAEACTPEECLSQQNSTGRQKRSIPQVRNFFALAPQPKLGTDSCPLVCPACGFHGNTQVKRSPNVRTHSWAFWLCSIGWCCCACVFPYLTTSCLITSHYCVSCETFLGAHYPVDGCF